MNRSPKRLLAIGLLALPCLVPWLGVAGADTPIDWQVFGQSIRDALHGKVTGWAYAVGEGDALRHWDSGGYRRLPVDGGQLRFNVRTKGQALSTTKTLTAIALVKALNDRGLTVDAKVSGFLPRCWLKGPGICGLGDDCLTFRGMLDHTSGLPASTGSGYAGLQQLVANGLTGTPGSYVYSNAAYTLMRYLVPLVAREPEAKAAFRPASRCETDGAEIDRVLSDMFSDYLIEQVLMPAGVAATDESIFTPDTNFAYLYNQLDQDVPGVPPNPDSEILTGAGRVSISVLEYKRVLAALDHGLILPLPLVETMYQGNLGFDAPAQGAGGTYYTKAGAVSAKGVSGGAQLMIYPNGVHAYVLVNSNIVGSARWFMDYEHDGTTNAQVDNWGLTDDRPVAGDFDGDGRLDDLAVFRSATGQWFFDYDHDGNTDEQIASWGIAGDLPLAGDFDSDGRADDLGIFRASGAGGTWFFDYDHDGTTDAEVDNWGKAGDLPLAGDFDRDGRSDDVAVLRATASASAWFFDFNHDGTTDAKIANWGLKGDLPLAGDFDGDGRIDDLAVLRATASGATWFFDYNRNGITDAQIPNWGKKGDLPVAGDLDGGGQVDDLAVIRSPRTSLRQVLAAAYDKALP